MASYMDNLVVTTDEPRTGTESKGPYLAWEGGVCRFAPVSRATETDCKCAPPDSEESRSRIVLRSRVKNGCERWTKRGEGDDL